jgi:hypothetical protein
MAELSNADRQKLLALTAVWEQRANSIRGGWQHSNKWERKDDFFRLAAELRAINAAINPPLPLIESFAKALDNTAKEIWEGWEHSDKWQRADDHLREAARLRQLVGTI